MHHEKNSHLIFDLLKSFVIFTRTKALQHVNSFDPRQRLFKAAKAAKLWFIFLGAAKLIGLLGFPE